MGMAVDDELLYAFGGTVEQFVNIRKNPSV
ncbi:MAG: Unknown protein [uncultured Thiotrichaceae bacterium]|uniref:Uncharacterized protein n=1 Tax=uncultured Thiotrichaceae bacterium TaxID=298394 RepID=A0A6S6TJY9_9GAMM|nr:MAG: Unknown protein [uncultured Thiotrichaceae bacterium]